VQIGDPFGVLSPRGVAQEPWYARGYCPDATHPTPQCMERQGTTMPRKPHDPLLTLDVSTRRDGSASTPGAAVWVNETIVGVIASAVMASSGAQLQATPVGYFLHLETFLRALGVSPREVSGLGELQREVKKLLTKHPRLCAALATHLECEVNIDTVVRTLMQTCALDAATAINYADADLAEQEPVPEDDRNAAEMVLECIVPYAFDRRVAVAAVQRAVAEGAGAVDVPTNSRTIIETVLAGVDVRACMFRGGRNGMAPIGKGDVPMPAATLAPVFDVVEEAFAMVLSADLNVTIPPNEPDPTAYINQKVEHRATRAAPRERLRYYFVLEDNAGTWAVAAQVIREKLPSLRLVRLGTSTPEDRDLESQLQDLYNRP
jgi:hypothetical protein